MNDLRFPVIDPQRIYRELSELADWYLKGQNPDTLLFKIRVAVERLRAILPVNPVLCDGISVEESLAVSDFIRHAAALYHLDDPAGLSDPSFFSPSLDEELWRLIERFRPVLAADLAPEPQSAPAVPVPQAAKPKQRRRGTEPRKPRELTPRQVEVVQAVAECKNNIAEAARRLGKNRKTVAECYKTAMGKLGKTAVRSRDKTRLLPRDKRGQEIVSDSDERF